MNREIDLEQVPFAKWLEEILPEVCRQDAKAIGIVVLNKDDTIGTAYFNALTADKGSMAAQLMLDAVWDLVVARRRDLKELLEDETEGEPEDETEEVDEDAE